MYIDTCLLYTSYIKAGLDVMTAIKKVAKDRKIPKNEVYKEYHKEEK